MNIEKTIQTDSTTNSAPPVYLTEREVALRHRCSVKLLQKLRRTGGGIPFRKFGSMVRYSAADVFKYEAESVRNNTSETATAAHGNWPPAFSNRYSKC